MEIIYIDSIHPDFIDVTYSYGWEDCPSGCISRYNYHVRVYSECKVELKSTSGTPPPSSISSITEEKMIIYPNPIRDYIRIIYDRKQYYFILNMVGETVNRGTITNQKINVDYLPSGKYILLLEGKNGLDQIQFIKE